MLVNTYAKLLSETYFRLICKYFRNTITDSLKNVLHGMEFRFSLIITQFTEICNCYIF